MQFDYAERLKKYDYSFWILTLVIFSLGLLNLYSATYDVSIRAAGPLVKAHLYKFTLALSIGVAVSFIHPKHFYRISNIAYYINIFFLLLVFIIGHKALGATRWLSLGPIKFQPSEMMKITVVLFLARWFSKVNPHNPIGLKEFILPFLFAFIPAILVIVQPDLGTGLLIIILFGMIILYKGIYFKTLMFLSIIALLSGALTYKYGLKNYQRKRISAFMNPMKDAKGSGYNAIQSEIAIGSGQLLGKGFRKSSQASLNFLPENHTDFVFSVYNEEHGFIGALFLILLYLALLIRFIWLSSNVINFYDSVVSIGLMAILFCHTVINMGMVTGVLPIVGLPLPFFSYGGSSLLTFCICCGMATSISNSRNFF